MTTSIPTNTPVHTFYARVHEAIQRRGMSYLVADDLAEEITKDLRTYAAVADERVRAHAKHDPNDGSMERKNPEDSAWLPVLVKEVGEVARALCEYHLGNVDAAVTADNLREELVQVAAMALAWVDSIENYVPPQVDDLDANTAASYDDSEPISHVTVTEDDAGIKIEGQLNEDYTSHDEIDIVFDRPPGPEAPRFVEVETLDGRSTPFGHWVKREHDWALRIPLYRLPPDQPVHETHHDVTTSDLKDEAVVSLINFANTSPRGQDASARRAVNAIVDLVRHLQ